MCCLGYGRLTTEETPQARDGLDQMHDDEHRINGRVAGSATETLWRVLASMPWLASYKSETTRDSSIHTSTFPTGLLQPSQVAFAQSARESRIQLYGFRVV